jgi:hypothetical protein
MIQEKTMKTTIVMIGMILSVNSFAAPVVKCTGGIMDKTSNVAVIDQVVSAKGQVLTSDRYYYIVYGKEGSGISIDLKRKTADGNESVANSATKDGNTVSLNFYPSAKEQAFIECTKH